MANNRLILKCEKCKEGVVLGKRMSEGYYNAPTQHQLQKFFDDHEWCDGGTGDGPLYGDGELDVFELEYETGKNVL